MKKSEGIELKPVVMAYLVTQLQMYSVLESDIDVKSRAYEEIVAPVFVVTEAGDEPRSPCWGKVLGKVKGDNRSRRP